MFEERNEEKVEITVGMSDEQATGITQGLSVLFGCQYDFLPHPQDVYNQLKSEKRVTYHDSLIKELKLFFYPLLKNGTISYEESQALFQVKECPDSLKVIFKQLANEKGIDISPAAYTLKKKASVPDQKKLLDSLITKLSNA